MTTLHPDLSQHLSDGGMFAMLRHPLVFSVPYFPGMDEQLNEMLRMKKEYLGKALADGDYERAVFLHERPYRLEAFLDYFADMTDSQYWKILESVWVDCEAPHVNNGVWRELWESGVPGRAGCMTDSEKAHLASLPDEVTVYRGFSETIDAVDGISWTTDRTTAEWFAKRFNKPNPRVAEAIVRKSDILVYFDRRNESEVILAEVDPWQITEL